MTCLSNVRLMPPGLITASKKVKNLPTIILFAILKWYQLIKTLLCELGFLWRLPAHWFLDFIGKNPLTARSVHAYVWFEWYLYPELLGYQRCVIAFQRTREKWYFEIWNNSNEKKMVQLQYPRTDANVIKSNQYDYALLPCLSTASLPNWSILYWIVRNRNCLNCHGQIYAKSSLWSGVCWRALQFPYLEKPMKLHRNATENALFRIHWHKKLYDG